MQPDRSVAAPLTATTLPGHERDIGRALAAVDSLFRGLLDAFMTEGPTRLDRLHWHGTRYWDPTRWPDGLPVHNLVLYVRLACGHERVSRGWRGEEGDTYCCDACHRLTTIQVVALTDEAPRPWRLAADAA